MKFPSPRRILFFLVPLSVALFIAGVGSVAGGVVAVVWSARLLDEFLVDREFERLCAGEPYSVPKEGFRTIQELPSLTPLHTSIQMFVVVGQPVPWPLRDGPSTYKTFDDLRDPRMRVKIPSALHVIAHKSDIGGWLRPQWTASWSEGRECRVRLGSGVIYRTTPSQPARHPRSDPQPEWMDF